MGVRGAGSGVLDRRLEDERQVIAMNEADTEFSFNIGCVIWVVITLAAGLKACGVIQ